MSRFFGENKMRSATILIAILCFSLSYTSVFALTKADLIAYHENVSNIVKENMFQLKPGSMKNAPLSQEEEQKRTMELMKIVGDFSNKKWAHDALSFYSVFFKKCAERLAKEVVTRDKDLSA